MDNEQLVAHEATTNSASPFRSYISASATICNEYGCEKHGHVAPDAPALPVCAWLVTNEPEGRDCRQTNRSQHKSKRHVQSPTQSQFSLFRNHSSTLLPLRGQVRVQSVFGSWQELWFQSHFSILFPCEIHACWGVRIGVFWFCGHFIGSPDTFCVGHFRTVSLKQSGIATAGIEQGDGLGPL